MIGLCGAAHQIGTKRAGIGKGHVAIETDGLGCGIEVTGSVRAIFLERQDKGAINRAHPQSRGACQAGEPQQYGAPIDPIEQSKPQMGLIYS